MNRLIYALFSVCFALLVCLSARADATAPSLTDRITAVLLAQTPHFSDRDEEPRAREARLRDVAAAISAGVAHARCRGAWENDPDCRPVWRGSPTELASAVIALGLHESHYAERIQSGNCGPHECDRDPRTHEPRSLGPWQAKREACPELHEQEPGSDGALRAGAFCAARLLGGFARYCTDAGQPTDWAGAFKKYGGRACRSEWSDGETRVAVMRRVAAKL
jgi:hypothetical protein